MKIQIKRTLLLLFFTIITAAAAVMVIMTTTGSDHDAKLAAASPQDAQLTALAEENGGIKQVVAGGNHSMVLFNNGKLYGTGRNSSGQLGLGNLYDKNSFTAANYFNGKTVTSVACGGRHTMVMADGKLYATGSNQYGQLGLGEDKVDKSNFTEVTYFDDKTVTSVVCGDDYSMVIADGKLYATGNNRGGQMGLGDDKSDKSNFTEVTYFDGKTVTSVVACRNDRTMVIADGKLYAAGKNNNGQLGLGTTVTDYSSFTEVTYFNGKTVTTVACGIYHTMVIADGKLYATGSNGYGQFGMGTTIGQRGFTEVTYFDGNTITSVACGESYTIVIADGKLYAAGKNDYGQLGLGDWINRRIFTEVSALNNKKITLISSNAYHAMAIADDNLFATGNNRFGELGLGDTIGRNTYTEISLNYRLSYDGNGGIVPDSAKGSVGGHKVPYHKPTELWANTFVREGWTFVGWAASSTSVDNDIVDYADKDVVVYLGSIGGYWTLSAVWRPDAPEVELEASANEMTFDGESCIELTANHTKDKDLKYSYKWYRKENEDFALVSNATEKTLKLQNVQDSGTYKVEVTAIYRAQSLSCISGEKTLKITPKELTEEMFVLGNTPQIYDGTRKTPTLKVSSKEPNLLQNYYQVKYGENINVGKGSIIIDGLDNYSGSVVMDFDIAKGTFKPTVELYNWIYNGTPNEPKVNNNKSGGACTYLYVGKSNNGTLYESSKVPVKAGEYTVKVTIAATDNYEAAEATSSKFFIKRAEIYPELTVDDWTYGDQPKVPKLEGCPNDATLNLKYEGTGNDGEKYTAQYNELAALDEIYGAGKYRLWLTIGQTHNYASESLYVDFVIHRKKIDAPKIDSKLKNGELLNADVSETADYTIASNDGGDTGGEYPVALELKDPDNTEWSAGSGRLSGKKKETLTLTFKIIENANEWTVVPSVPDVEYGQEVTLNFKAAYGDVVIMYLDKDGNRLEFEPVAVGHYIARFSVEETTDHTGLVAEAEFDVLHKAITVKIDDKGHVYGESEAELSYHVTDGSVIDGDDLHIELGREQGTNVGTYKITGTFENSNYTVTFEDGEYVIEQAEYNMRNVAFDDKVVTYDGNEHFLEVTGLPAGVSVKYTSNGQTNAGDYTVTATFEAEDTTNYKALAITEKEATLTINKARYAMDDVAFEGKTVTYDGNEHSLKVTGLPEGVSVEYVNNNKTNAGEYKITATFMAADTTNYEPLAITDMTAKLTINKAKYDMDEIAFEGKTITYDGNKHSLEVTGLPAGVSVGYVNNDMTNAGEYEVTATFIAADTTNYEPLAIADLTAKLTINKAKYDMSRVEFADKTITYDGNIHSLEVTGLPEGVTVEYIGNGKKEAGTYAVIAKFTGDANYEAIGDLTATLTIEAAPANGGCGSVVTDGLTIAGLAISVLAFAALLYKKRKRQ